MIRETLKTKRTNTRTNTRRPSQLPTALQRVRSEMREDVLVRALKGSISTAEMFRRLDTLNRRTR